MKIFFCKPDKCKPTPEKIKFIALFSIAIVLLVSLVTFGVYKHFRSQAVIVIGPFVGQNDWSGGLDGGAPSESQGLLYSIGWNKYSSISNMDAPTPLSLTLESGKTNGELVSSVYEYNCAIDWSIYPISWSDDSASVGGSVTVETRTADNLPSLLGKTWDTIANSFDPSNLNLGKLIQYKIKITRDISGASPTFNWIRINTFGDSCHYVITPDKPENLSPADGATNISQFFSFNLPFSANYYWENYQQKYQIQIDNHSDFSSPIVDYISNNSNISESSFDPSFSKNYNFIVGQAAGSGKYIIGNAGQSLAPGTYYWRVRAKSIGDIFDRNSDWDDLTPYSFTSPPGTESQSFSTPAFNCGAPGSCDPVSLPSNAITVNTDTDLESLMTGGGYTNLVLAKSPPNANFELLNDVNPIGTYSVSLDNNTSEIDLSPYYMTITFNFSPPVSDPTKVKICQDVNHDGIFNCPNAPDKLFDSTTPGVTSDVNHITFMVDSLSNFLVGIQSTPVPSYSPEEKNETNQTPQEEANEIPTTPTTSTNPVSQLISYSLEDIELSPIPEFNPIFGANFPAGRVNWALEHRSNIYRAYQEILGRTPSPNEVNWWLQYSDDINLIRYLFLTSDECKINNCG